jgi:hypothetical protein
MRRPRGEPALPQCPELNGLEVWPPELRSQGIGTAIICADEARARERGCHQIGLGVTDDNPRAAALYLRLGYQEIGYRYLDRCQYLDDHGRRHDIADPARFLVKQLQASSPAPTGSQGAVDLGALGGTPNSCGG